MLILIKKYGKLSLFIQYFIHLFHYLFTYKSLNDNELQTQALQID